jgi:predicted O-methyltransferase YrrM
MPGYHFTKTWFANSELRQILTSYLEPTQENHMLEIGCFEGAASVFFADIFLSHPQSSLTCVDPFLRIEDNDHKEFLEEQEELTFDTNLSLCANQEKITIYKLTSDAFFAAGTERYNFIYIDGCHEPAYIARDIRNSFKRLDEGGLMWMDDYLGGEGTQIRDTIDSVLAELPCEVVHKGYQIAVRKLRQTKTASPEIE